jgi:hypothetical protein
MEGSLLPLAPRPVRASLQTMCTLSESNNLECALQVRHLLREIGPEAYDAAARLRPETCPMYYMGDRRTGCQLLQDAAADAAVPLAALFQRFSLGNSESAGQPYPGGESEQKARAADSDGGGYARACGGQGLLYGIAAAVERLTGVLASAEPEGLNLESWARAVREISKWQ